jgi:hypothetical protein
VSCNFNCLIALTLIKTEKRKNEAADLADDDNYKMVKGKVFNASISMILDDKDDKVNSNEAVVKTILTGFPFPFENKISDKQSWFSQHFTIALGVRNKISEEDIRIMLSADPSPVHQLTKREGGAYIMRDKRGRCALHLVVQYSESLELLQDVLQIDHKMTKLAFESKYSGADTIPLGLLCIRPHFATFDAMMLSLIDF